MIRRISTRAVSTLLLGVSTAVANASGFALIEQNASGLGNAYAGSAAITQDASAIYFNPAGLTRLSGDRQVVAAANFISPSAKFHNNGGTQSAGAALGVTPVTYPGTGNGGNAGSLALIPNLYAAMRLNSQLSIGLGINAPFGLSTEYDDDWVGRFQGLKSELKTYNINPTLAYKLNDKVSLGIGINYQHIDATLTKAVNYNAAAAAAGGAAAIGAAAVGPIEGRNKLTGSDSGWGYNFGILFELSPATQLGLAYRSSIRYRLTGTHKATHPVTGNAALNTFIVNNPTTIDQDVSLDLEVPDSFTTSVVQRLSDNWEMMGDLSWTGWSKVKELRVKYANGATDDVTPYNFRDTWRFALGANYKASETMKYRFGVAYDQTPTNSTDRTARLPDGSRTWLSVGLQYKPTTSSVLDAGFSYIFVRDPSISTNGGVKQSGLGYGRGFLSGHYENNVKILGVQYTYNF